MSDQQPPSDPPRWGPPDPLSEPTRARPSPDADGDRPTAPAPPPAAPTALPGPPPPGPPPAAPPPPPPASPAPQPGWTSPPGYPPTPGVDGFTPPPSPPPRRRKIWPFALGGGLMVVLVGVLVVVLVTQSGGGGSASASGYYDVAAAAVSEDAELAWSEQAPDGLEVRSVAQLGDDTLLARYNPPYSSEDDEESDDADTDLRIVAYDMDGEEQWTVTDTDLEWASPSLSGEFVFADLGDAFAALDPEDGEELWSVDGEPGNTWEVDDLMLATIEEDDESRVAVIDIASGEEQATVEGGLVGAPGPDSFVVQDDEVLRRVEFSGEEIWSADAADLDLDTEEPLMAAFGDGVIMLSGFGNEGLPLVAVDPETGEELWHETGRYQVQFRGTGGAVGVVRWSDEGDEEAYESAPGELLLVDAEGERDAVDVDMVGRYGQMGFLDVDGDDYYAESESGTLISADLEIIAEYDASIVGYTTDGVYMQDDDELTLAAWESDDERFSIDLEHDGTVSTLDGAVAVMDEESTEFGIYR